MLSSIERGDFMKNRLVFSRILGLGCVIGLTFQTSLSAGRYHENAGYRDGLVARSAAVFREMPTPLDTIQGEKRDAEKKRDTGSLFSAILFGKTELGQRWAKLRPEAETQFPHLKLKSVDDLHMTIIYIGKNWRRESLDTLRRAMAVQVQDTILLTPEIANLGRNNQVIVVELKGLLGQLTSRIIEVKLKLNEAGLKSPETYDSSFRAHVTLAEAKDNPPTDEQARELKAFREWITSRLDLITLKVALDPSMPIQLMLAGASRPTPIPEYITVESFLLIK